MTAKARRIVWDYWRFLADGYDDAGAVIHEFCHPDLEWHGFRPLQRRTGVDAFAADVWGPVLRAFPDIARRPYVFLAGEFEDAEWVAGTGDLVGTFVRDWLGIPATGHRVHFRFGEFCRVDDGRIAEIRMLVDLPELIAQTGADEAGIAALGANEPWVPGPVAGDGIGLAPRDRRLARDTLRLVETMIFDGLNRYDGDQESQGLERFWHPDMVWHGPRGLGTAQGLSEFKAKAQGPVVAAVPDRRGVGHRARIADGHFAASTGWPSLVGTHTGEFLGWSPTNRETRWNIMDFWRAENGKLRENWVLVDLVDVAHQAGIDLLPERAVV